MVVKPQKNEDNEITWESENDTLAWLAFTSDDNAAKFYPKMITKWRDQDYTDYFADQDAYLYDFIGNPQIASTSRATLDLRYPFVDEDGELTVDPENAGRLHDRRGRRAGRISPPSSSSSRRTTATTSCARRPAGSAPISSPRSRPHRMRKRPGPPRKPPGSARRDPPLP